MAGRGQNPACWGSENLGWRNMLSMEKSMKCRCLILLIFLYSVCFLFVSFHVFLTVVFLFFSQQCIVDFKYPLIIYWVRSARIHCWNPKPRVLVAVRWLPTPWDGYHESQCLTPCKWEGLGIPNIFCAFFSNKQGMPPMIEIKLPSFVKPDGFDLIFAGQERFVFSIAICRRSWSSNRF